MSTPEPIVQPIADILGEPYTAETIPLPDDDEGGVVATLVRRPADGGGATRGAVLHVHGFCDYFFQTEYAAWWTSRGYDFYALDLRKYGRSLRPHHTPNYVSDLADYFPELDEAWRRVTERDGHAEVLLSAHSTGGLTVPLWADDRRPRGLAGMVLNSPWLDLQGSELARTVGTLALEKLGNRLPKVEIPRSVTGFYSRSLHRDHEGEWDFDLAWKPLASFPVRMGWLRAIRQGHAALQAGLDVTCPVLVLSSHASKSPREMGEDVHRHDVVLDVEHIRRWSTAVGRHVTYVAVPGARHDVVLSLPDVRERVYRELDTWWTAYVKAPCSSE
jgi:alpha-beta hydrolase superfamily lysophospholipase